MRKIALSILMLLVLVLPASAQFVPKPLKGSTSAEGAHDFTSSATAFNNLAITWATATTPRYLMLFDSNAGVPANGATTGCGSSPTNGCLDLCMYLPESTIAPNRFTLGYLLQPIQMKFGTVVGLSTAADCTTFTVDGNNDFFYIQVLP